MHKYIQLKTINEKGSHEFEREWGRLYGRFWREESKGRNSVIKLKSQKGLERERDENTKTEFNQHGLLGMMQTLGINDHHSPLSILSAV